MPGLLKRCETLGIIFFSVSMPSQVEQLYLLLFLVLLLRILDHRYKTLKPVFGFLENYDSREIVRLVE